MKKNPNKISELIIKCLKDPALLSQLKKDPKKWIEKELNIQLPASYQLEVIQETSEKGYIVLPPAEIINDCSDEELKAIVGGTKQNTAWCLSCLFGSTNKHPK